MEKFVTSSPIDVGGSLHVMSVEDLALVIMKPI
jgi:hypothetical protein